MKPQQAESKQKKNVRLVSPNSKKNHKKLYLKTSEGLGVQPSTFPPFGIILMFDGTTPKNGSSSFID